MTEDQWRAIKESDASYDGKFCYGLKTKKTICRPSCTARKCVAENTVIFNSCQDGIEAGYHPCRYCRPDLPQWRGFKQAHADAAKKYLEEHYTEKFSLDTIANALYVNKIYLAKCFKQATGDTLLKYLNRLRCAEASRLLTRTDMSIELIGSKVGYETSSHFIHIFKGIYDCTPLQYRKQHIRNLK